MTRVQATNDADGYALYAPSGPDGQLVGSDFTSFFLAAVTNLQVNGMRLQKVPSCLASYMEYLYKERLVRLL